MTMNNPELDLNEQGNLSKAQRQSIFRYIGLRFGLIAFVGSLIGLLNTPSKNVMGLSVIFFIGVAFFICFLLFPPLGRSPNLLRDALAGRVIEDCGVITYHFAQSPRRLGMAFLLVDNERVYWWDKNVSAGFESGQSGCIYFAPHSRLALNIEKIEVAD